MTPEVEDLVRAHAVAEFPNECCGVVIVRKGRERYMPCANKSASPRSNFIMCPRDLALAEDQGEVVAIVHSHCIVPPRPSHGDLQQCENTGVEWHIVHAFNAPDGSVTTGEIYSFRPSGYEAPLVGREFLYGVLDCWELVRDWYKRERGITLKRWESEDKWWERGENLYERYFDEAGFVRVCMTPSGDLDVSQLEVGDVILMQVRSQQDSNHAAIYIGDGLILHHVYNRLSSRDVYGGMWQDVTRIVGRYKGTGE